MSGKLLAIPRKSGVVLLALLCLTACSTPISITLQTGSASMAAQVPDWFAQCNLPHDAAERLGCGQGKTQQDARANALAAIAQQLKVSIQSEVERNQLVHDSQISVTEKVNLLVRSELELNVDQELRKVELQGVWYVALSYIDLPFAKKLAKRFRRFPPRRYPTPIWHEHLWFKRCTGKRAVH